MRLHASTTSPFVRKVLVAAHELGRAADIEVLPTKTLATSPDPTLASHNPLAKIPALEIAPNDWLYDSKVICEYLDEGHKLIPPSGRERFVTLRRQALADGVIEAAVLVVYEARRPEAQQYGAWVEGQLKKVLGGLDALNREATSYGNAFDLGHLTVACALGYLDFRKIGGDVRHGRDALYAWYDRVAARPSLVATTPREA